MTKKRILAVLIAAMVFAGVGFVACNKDTMEESTVIEKNATVEEEMVIARCPKGSTDIELLFDVNSAVSYAEQEATKTTLTDVIVEEISIMDEKPTDLNYQAHLLCASFLPAKGMSERFIAEVTKYEDPETGDILYKVAGGAKITGTCTGNNCKGEGNVTACNPTTDDNDNFVGCTLCTNEDGKCSSTSSLTHSNFLDKLLAAMVSGIKLNLNFNH